MLLKQLRFAAFAIGLAAMMASPSSQAKADPAEAAPAETQRVRDLLAEVETWRFAATALAPDGTSECVETWTFRADGSSTVVSGEQVVTSTWRVESDGDGTLWLLRTDSSSTSGTDCLGNVADPADYPRAERGVVLMFFNNGAALTCSAPDWAQGPDGKLIPLWSAESCWGSISPQTGEPAILPMQPG